MFKAIVFAVVGAGAMYLYLNPGDVDGLVETGKDAIHEGASSIAEATRDDPVSELRKELAQRGLLGD